jgi:hypothetical protein
MASFGKPLAWPEEEKVALRLILLYYTRDLTEKPGPARDVAMKLIALGLQIALTCPAPATLDRRIDSWQAICGMTISPHLTLDQYLHCGQIRRNFSRCPNISQIVEAFTLGWFGETLNGAATFGTPTVISSTAWLATTDRRSLAASSH